MFDNITLITGNPKKAEQIGFYLEAEITHKHIDLEEIQSMDVEEIAIKKAEQAFRLIEKPVLVEDTSLSFTALGGLPGPFIKWFLESIGSAGLCKLLTNEQNRHATATTCVVLYDETGPKTFIGETKGTIAKEPHGDTDFGWNNIFIPDGSNTTWSLMSMEDMAKDSMRLKALDKLKTYLKDRS